jgi:hypothetical protein
MIMIDSKAGQRLARARQKVIDTGIKQQQPWLDAIDEFDEAATELANELITAGHADAEDYS